MIRVTLRTIGSSPPCEAEAGACDVRRDSLSARAPAPEPELAAARTTGAGTTGAREAAGVELARPAELRRERGRERWACTRALAPGPAALAGAGGAAGALARAGAGAGTAAGAGVGTLCWAAGWEPCEESPEVPALPLTLLPEEPAPEAAAGTSGVRCGAFDSRRAACLTFDLTTVLAGAALPVLAAGLPAASAAGGVAPGAVAVPAASPSTAPWGSSPPE